jgi:hypothetical protein
MTPAFLRSILQYAPEQFRDTLSDGRKCWPAMLYMPQHIGVDEGGHASLGFPAAIFNSWPYLQVRNTLQEGMRRYALTKISSSLSTPL